MRMEVTCPPGDQWIGRRFECPGPGASLPHDSDAGKAAGERCMRFMKRRYDEWRMSAAYAEPFEALVRPDAADAPAIAAGKTHPVRDALRDRDRLIAPSTSAFMNDPRFHVRGAIAP